VRTALLEEFHRRPSVAAYMARALLPSRGLRRTGVFPRIVERWSPVRIDPDHLRAFLALSGLSTADGVPILYPHVFGFPLHMALLTRRAFPLPIWRALQTRNHLLRHRHFTPDESFDLETRVAAERLLDRGAEVDLTTTLTSGGERVWESLVTFFYRGRYGAAQAASPLARSPEPDGSPMARWHVPSGVGWRFARLTGDYNGIHWMNAYARLFGFRSAFHHPQLVLGQCLARLSPPARERQRLDAWLKGPVFYDTDVTLRAASGADGVRFAVSMEGEARPSIVGRWSEPVQYDPIKEDRS
jgi:hypothetical protein